jgi:hypothetical protein
MGVIFIKTKIIITLLVVIEEKLKLKVLTFNFKVI